MPSIFTSRKFFFQLTTNRPIDHQSTCNDRLKPVMTTGLVNMHIDRLIADLDAPAKFEVATSNSLGEDAFTRKCII